MSSGSSRGNPVDIIDLDRYMRVSVMPSRQQSQLQRCGDLVVDAGGVQHLSAIRSSGDNCYTPPPQTRAPASANKRFSHDSGVSDSSYVKRRPRRYKHRSDSSESPPRSQRERFECSSAMTEFRSNCEQTLLEQQKQIAQLAALCDRLVGPNTNLAVNPQGRDKGKKSSTVKTNKPKKVEPKYSTTSSSDTSSTSQLSNSSRDARRRDYKTDSCKTYKIMMDRLDDLSRVISNRRPQSVAPVRRSTVLVCNKVVATDSDKFATRTSTVRNMTVSDRREDCRTVSSVREAHALGVSAPQTLNIAPALIERSNMITERMCERHFVFPNKAAVSFSQLRVVHGSSSSGDIRSRFHLDDPIQFHAQGKVIQALHASAYASVPAEETAPQPSLCSVCRTYWRAIRSRISHTFGTNL